MKKQYYPVAKYKKDSGYDLLSTYDAVDSMAEAKRQITIWAVDYHLVTAFVQVLEDGKPTRIISIFGKENILLV